MKIWFVQKFSSARLDYVSVRVWLCQEKHLFELSVLVKIRFCLVSVHWLLTSILQK